MDAGQYSFQFADSDNTPIAEERGRLRRLAVATQPLPRNVHASLVSLCVVKALSR